MLWLLPPIYGHYQTPIKGFQPQPDTYNGTYWASTSSSEDHGGVHTNSGVQNYWFYLLSQGGTGTNDLETIFCYRY